MSKELDIINNWKSQIHWQKDWGWNKELETVEKSVKALEIIKEKQVEVYSFYRARDLEHYNETVAWLKPYYLTEEEYNLLKEVLGELPDD